MIYEYIEKNQLKNEKNDILYFKQIQPFTFGKIFTDIVSIAIYNNSIAFYSKKTKQCLGISNIVTKKFFVEV